MTLCLVQRWAFWTVGICLILLVSAGCTRDATDTATHIRSLAMPQVERVTGFDTWEPGESELSVLLVTNATDADARAVWCDAIIPADVDRGIHIDVYVRLDAADKVWPRPRDCDDPSDIPKPRLVR